MALRPAMTSREHRHSQSHNDLSSLASSSLPHFASHSRLFSFTELEHHNKDPKLEIHLDADVVKLRGVGVDVEPARLSGHVVLQLAERTSIKEITLQFKGKARLPTGPAESSSHQYSVCVHDWSFLEGEKKHSHTLKAGRHCFPFQLELGGDLPATLAASVFGGISVAYKLRAHVTRPGFGHNLQATTPITIVRSFPHLALEYQQSLELENTWPDKIMYSITVPHKAWAAGDNIIAIFKLSPLTKGVSVLDISTTINEHFKVTGRFGHLECDRVAYSCKHEVVNRSPVLAAENGSAIRRCSRASSAPATPGGSPSNEHLPSLNGLSPEELETQVAETDLVFSVSIPLPVSMTSTHTLDPVMVSHRIRWSIFLLNPDGHTSELRCSLPLHILHPCLLDEAIASTRTTRRLLLGISEEEQTEDADNELPSYNAHLRDRVANMFLSDVVTLRVSNPWVLQNRSPVIRGHETPATRTSASRGEARLVPHLPNVPSSEESSPLHWVNYELLLSLSENRPDAPSGPDTSNTQSGTESGSSSRNSRTNSRPNSLIMSNTRPNSTRQSRANSRASSPERGERTAPTSETYVHGESQASRALPSVFKAGLKPLSTITPPWLSARSASLPSVPALTHPVTPPTLEAAPSALSHAVARVPPAPSVSDAELLHRAFTAVPDYEVASRGFLGGGVTPLTSMQGLPSYEEASRQPNRVSV